MPASLGIMVTRCRYYQIGPLRVADTQFLSLDKHAYRQFGVDDPRLIVGTHMSDWQDAAWRQMGHDRYRDRKMGRPVTKDYVVELTHPDGTTAYQRREFGGWMAGPDPGEDIYLTYVEEVREVAHGPILRVRDPEEQRAARHYNGDCTVADLRRMASDPQQLPLALRETFPHIIREGDALSRGHFVGKYPTTLDFLLSDDSSVCWYGASQTTSLVRSRFVCDRCGWIWFGRARRQAECPACGKHFREYRKT